MSRWRRSPRRSSARRPRRRSSRTCNLGCRAPTSGSGCRSTSPSSASDRTKSPSRSSAAGCRRSPGRSSRLWYGVVQELGIDYGYDYSITYTSSSWEKNFFKALRRLAAPAYLTGFQVAAVGKAERAMAAHDYPGTWEAARTAYELVLLGADKADVDVEASYGGWAVQPKVKSRNAGGRNAIVAYAGFDRIGPGTKRGLD